MILGREMDQEKYDMLFTYLTHKKLPEKLNKNERESIKRRSESFSVRNGLLFKLDRKTSIDQQVRPTRHPLLQQTWPTVINELTRDVHVFNHLCGDK